MPPGRPLALQWRSGKCHHACHRRDQEAEIFLCIRGAMASNTLRDPQLSASRIARSDGITPDDIALFPLDDAVCAEIARDLAPCLPEEYLAAYVQRVGIATASLHILRAWLDRNARDYFGGFYSAR